MADKFAARQCEKYTVVSLLPDVCLTPSSNGTPVPYPVDIDLSGSANVSPNVNFNDDGAFLYNQSDTVIVKNDEAGQGLGIVSGTVSEKAEAITSSESVIINGKQLVREGDLFFMNEKNTIGKLTTTESGGGDAKITEEGIEGKTVPNDFDKDGWPDDVPNPDADIGPPKPRRERTLSEKIENWSREAGQNNTEILDEELESIAEKIDQAKEAYAKGDYSAMSGAVIMAVADAFDPLKKVKMAGKMAKGGGKGKAKKDKGKKKCKAQTPKGECAEKLIEKHFKGKDFEPLDTDTLKNKSGHGLDHVFKDKKTGELLFVESKSTSTGGKMKLSKKQNRDGSDYVKDQIEEMNKASKGDGRWQQKEDDEDFGEALNQLNEEVDTAPGESYKVARIQLEDDPSGCYGQKVNKQGKLSPTGKKSGTCKIKAGTKIEEKVWVTGA